MDAFGAWFGPVLALCLGVMTLTGFFPLVGMIRDRVSPPAAKLVKVLLKDTERVTIHLSGAALLEDVRVVGFVQTTGTRGIPYPLAPLLVVETADGHRSLVRAVHVRMISTAPLAGGPGRAS